MLSAEIMLLVLGCGPDFMPSLIMDRGKALGRLVEARFDETAFLIDLTPSPATDTFALGERARERLLADDFAGAVVLYAQQAALDHGGSGVISLRIVARQLVTRPEQLQRALQEPKVEALISLFAYTRGGYGTLDEEIQRALKLMVARPRAVHADTLAAALFRYGQLKEAQNVLDRPGGDLLPGLRAWVQAKLAIAKGDTAKAKEALTRALTRLPSRELVIAASTDLALLVLAEGDYRRALDLMLSTGDPNGYGTALYWNDAAYLAERVLDTAALSEFVANEKNQRCGLANDYAEARCLPSLLGRRLMREGKTEAAVALFKREANLASGRDATRILGFETRIAELTAYPIARAEVVFAEAALMRRRGMEIYGTELAPDWAMYGGEYEPVTEEAIEASLAARYVSNDERRRVMTSIPKPTQRFHYRARAADLAEHAADLVPARSQAFAALICHAMRFNGEKQRLWKKYVKKGAIVSFSFEDACPQPEFARAQEQADASKRRALQRFWRWLPRVALSALMGALVLLVWRRRRRRAASS